MEIKSKRKAKQIVLTFESVLIYGSDVRYIKKALN